MTTWPPRFSSAMAVMQRLVQQRNEAMLKDRVHCVLLLSEEEVCDTQYRHEACELIRRMIKLRVEVIYDKGNIRSHKKLIPVIEKYPDNPILVVDDDNYQQEGWLQAFVDEYENHPSDIIYGQGHRRVFLDNGKISEVWDDSTMFRLSLHDRVTTNIIPACGASGTLFPAHTFTDKRFFDRDLFMRICPSDDETWQFAFAKIAGKTFRCLSSHNFPYAAPGSQHVSLFCENDGHYESIQAAIAEAIPEYIPSLT